MFLRHRIELSELLEHFSEEPIFNIRKILRVGRGLHQIPQSQSRSSAWPCGPYARVRIPRVTNRVKRRYTGPSADERSGMDGLSTDANK
jgi:hypothetical protein